MTTINNQLPNFPYERVVHLMDFNNLVKIKAIYEALIETCGIEYKGEPLHTKNCGVSLYVMDPISNLSSLVIELPGFNLNTRRYLERHCRFKSGHSYVPLIDHSHDKFRISGDYRVTKEAVEEVRRRFS